MDCEVRQTHLTLTEQLSFLQFSCPGRVESAVVGKDNTTLMPTHSEKTKDKGIEWWGEFWV